MTDLIGSYDIPDLYCPDAIFQRTASRHTLRQRNYTSPSEYIVNVKRFRCNDGIPITQMDDYICDKSIFGTPSQHGTYGSDIDIPLGKKEMYDAFIFYIEELCSSKTTTYDKRYNMNKTSYKVPIIGYFQNDLPSPSQHEMLMDTDLTKDDDSKFIMIRHKMYSLSKYYREVGLEYTEVNIPPKYFLNVKLDDKEKFYTPHNAVCSKDKITFSFHHDIVISSLLIKPEKMRFKHVHGDSTYSRFDRRNKSIMRKPKYYINVLENNPGFISKFELQYRSELTNGRWVKHGIYNGNVSISDTVKISFDKIQVKEMRIIPITFHESFEHVEIKFIGDNYDKISSDEVFVIYEISAPRDGTYLTYSSKVLQQHSLHKNILNDMKIYRHGKEKRHTQEMIRDSLKHTF